MPDRGKQYCVVLGGGGHAAVLIESLRRCGNDIARAILDAKPSAWGREVLGVPILGSDEMLRDLRDRGADCFLVGVGTIGTGRVRRRLFDYGLSCGLDPLPVVHSAAILSPSATLGRGCQVLAGAIVHTRAILGNNVIVNCGSIVEHDCTLGNDVHVATGAKLAGGVIVGDGSMIGLGAAIRQEVRIGQNAIVGAGAVVVKDVPDNSVVVGVPARPIRSSGC
jgi:sugar O-acyltransferase (sialic acid O-acetyltransferase NeuD family)